MADDVFDRYLSEMNRARGRYTRLRLFEMHERIRMEKKDRWVWGC